MLFQRRGIDEVEHAMYAGQGEDPAGEPDRLDDREVDGMVRAVVVGAEDGRQACKVDESDVVKIEHEQSGAIEVNAVERAQQPPDAGEVKVSCHPKDQHRVGMLHGQAQRLTP